MRSKVKVYGILTIAFLISTLACVAIGSNESDRQVADVFMWLFCVFAILFFIFLIVFIVTSVTTAKKARRTEKAAREKEKFERDLAKQKMLIDAELKAKENELKKCMYCGASYQPSAGSCPNCGAKS